MYWNGNHCSPGEHWSYITPNDHQAYNHDHPIMRTFSNHCKQSLNPVNQRPLTPSPLSQWPAPQWEVTVSWAWRPLAGLWWIGCCYASETLNEVELVWFIRKRVGEKIVECVRGAYLNIRESSYCAHAVCSSHALDDQHNRKWEPHRECEINLYTLTLCMTHSCVGIIYWPAEQASSSSANSILLLQHTCARPMRSSNIIWPSNKKNWRHFILSWSQPMFPVLCWTLILKFLLFLCSLPVFSSC